MSVVGFNVESMEELVSKIRSAGSLSENYSSEVINLIDQFAEESGSNALKEIATQHKENKKNIQALDDTISSIVKVLEDTAERVREEDKL